MYIFPYVMFLFYYDIFIDKDTYIFLSLCFLIFSVSIEKKFYNMFIFMKVISNQSCVYFISCVVLVTKRSVLSTSQSSFIIIVIYKVFSVMARLCAICGDSRPLISSKKPLRSDTNIKWRMQIRRIYLFALFANLIWIENCKFWTVTNHESRIVAAP